MNVLSLPSRSRWIPLLLLGGLVLGAMAPLALLEAGSSRSKKPAAPVFSLEAMQKERARLFAKIEELSLADKRREALQEAERFIAHFALDPRPLGRLALERYVDAQEVSSQSQDEEITEKPSLLPGSLGARLQAPASDPLLQEVLAMAAQITFREKQFSKVVSFLARIEDPSLLLVHFDLLLKSAKAFAKETGTTEQEELERVWQHVMVAAKRLEASSEENRRLIARTALLFAQIKQPSSAQERSKSSWRHAMLGEIISHNASYFQGKFALEALFDQLPTSAASASVRVARAPLSAALRSLEPKIDWVNYFGWTLVEELCEEAAVLAQSDLPGQFPITDLFTWNYIEYRRWLYEGRRQEAQSQLFELLKHANEPLLEAFVLHALCATTHASYGAFSLYELPQESFSSAMLETIASKLSHLDQAPLALALPTWLSLAGGDSLTRISWERASQERVPLSVVTLRAMAQDAASAKRPAHVAKEALERLLTASSAAVQLYPKERLIALEGLVEQAHHYGVLAASLTPTIDLLAKEFRSHPLLLRALNLRASRSMASDEPQRALEDYQQQLSLAPQAPLVPWLQAQCGLLCTKLGQYENAWGYLDQALGKSALPALLKGADARQRVVLRNAWRAFIQVNFALMDSSTAQKYKKARMQDLFGRLEQEESIAARHKGYWVAWEPLRALVEQGEETLTPQERRECFARMEQWSAFAKQTPSKSFEKSFALGASEMLLALSKLSLESNDRDATLRFLARFWHGYEPSTLQSELAASLQLRSKEEKRLLPLLARNWLYELEEEPLSLEEKQRFLELMQEALALRQEWAPLAREVAWAQFSLHPSATLARRGDDLFWQELFNISYEQFEQAILGEAEREQTQIPPTLSAILMDPFFLPSGEPLILTPPKSSFIDRLKLLGEHLYLSSLQPSLDEELTLLSSSALLPKRTMEQEEQLARQLFFLGRLYLYGGEFFKAKELFSKLRRQRQQFLRAHENEASLKGDRMDATYQLYLGLAQEFAPKGLGDAFHTYNGLLGSLEAQGESSSSLLQLHTARVGVRALSLAPLKLQELFETRQLPLLSPRLRRVTELYELLVELRSAESEPRHFEAAIELAFLRALLEEDPMTAQLRELREVRKVFTQSTDLRSLEYGERVKSCAKTRALCESYILLVDAMIAQIESAQVWSVASPSMEAPSQGQEVIDSSLVMNRPQTEQTLLEVKKAKQEMLAHMAKLLYQQILAPDTASSDFLREHASWGRKLLEER